MCCAVGRKICFGACGRSVDQNLLIGVVRAGRREESGVFNDPRRGGDRRLQLREAGRHQDEKRSRGERRVAREQAHGRRPWWLERYYVSAEKFLVGSP